jgi:hypothetical protein
MMSNHGCGDTGCIFGHTGQGTNGGCKCLVDVDGPEPWVTIRRKIYALRADYDALKTERDLLSNVVSEFKNTFSKTDAGLVRGMIDVWDEIAAYDEWKRSQGGDDE